jgi:hypothetical protein
MAAAEVAAAAAAAVAAAAEEKDEPNATQSNTPIYNAWEATVCCTATIQLA